ncbi:MAG: DNA methylase [Oscillospiraceae bacterium]|nr:DNA methylase [Oscillospiraceae bacterium]
MEDKVYIAIDLKSFYASVECVDRKLDPLSVNLVVADPNRTEKTICLAVSPSLKAFGIGGRARLFEVVQRVEQINSVRKLKAKGRRFSGSSYYAAELEKNPSLALDYIVAPPRMAHYMEVSAKIYDIYLRYVAPEDMHVYSIDEVFIDATPYVKARKITAREFASMLVNEVFEETGITATAGIGTNMYLCKIAMDIVAKRITADKNGVRIAELDEMSYRRQLWEHRPITDFWRVGKGYAKRLAERGLFTMGDVARCSVCNEDLLYRLFGINAELLIDHAWGWEPCTIADIKAYRPENNSISSGQVLQCPYDFEKAKLVVREMTDMLVLDLVDKGLSADQMVLTVGYDIDNIYPDSVYQGEVVTDHYGRKVPKSAHGSINLGGYTSSSKKIIAAVMELYDKIVDETLLVRRMYVVANHIIPESNVNRDEPVQLDFFTDHEAAEKEQAENEREKNMQRAMLEIKKKYGKNAVLKGMNLKEGATAMERNNQVGGHKA